MRTGEAETERLARVTLSRAGEPGHPRLGDAVLERKAGEPLVVDGDEGVLVALPTRGRRAQAELAARRRLRAFVAQLDG